MAVLVLLLLLTSAQLSAASCKMVKQEGKRCAGAPSKTTTLPLYVCEMVCRLSVGGPCMGYNVLPSSCQGGKCLCRMYEKCVVTTDASETLYKKECQAKLHTPVITEQLDLAATDRLNGFQARLGAVVGDLNTFRLFMMFYYRDTVPKEQQQLVDEIEKKGLAIARKIWDATRNAVFPTKFEPPVGTFKPDETGGTMATMMRYLNKAVDGMHDLLVEIVKAGSAIVRSDPKFGQRVLDFISNVVTPISKTMQSYRDEVKAAFSKKSKAEELLKRLMEALLAFQAAN